MGTNPVYAASHADALTARIAVSRGDWVRAEADGRKARAGFVAHPPYQMIASAPFILGLVHLGRAEEAATIAREDLAVLARMGSPVCPKCFFESRRPRPCSQAGPTGSRKHAARGAPANRTAGREDLRPLPQGIVPDPREENRRAAELARAWLEKS